MPARPEPEIRKAIVAAAKHLYKCGLSPGRSGNVSVRFEGGMLITASGRSPGDMRAPADVVFVDGEGTASTVGRAPSTEWLFHHAIYRTRPDAGSVVHCHSRFATALACAGKPIPAFHYMVAKGGRAEIPLAQYATFGSEALAAFAAETLTLGNACLLANHGQIAIGETLESALELAEEVETLAAQYVAALTVGSPILLDDEEMARVVEKFKTYGKG